MRNLGLRILINAAALIVTSLIIPGIHLPKAPGAADWFALIVIALIFALINSFLKPIVKLLSLPVTLVTLGLFASRHQRRPAASAGVDLRAGRARLLDLRVPAELQLDAIWTAFLAGIIISIVASLLSRVFDRDE